MKILALDVEGTIICEYDFFAETTSDRFHARIDKNLKATLKIFHDANFKIVLATGTDKANLNYYKLQFERAGFAQYIDAYSPDKHSKTDAKEDKLVKYQQQYHVKKNEIFYLDDAEENVERAKKAGFKNAYVVTKQLTLNTQLIKLANQLNLIKPDHTQHVKFFSPPHANDTSVKTSSIHELILRQ